MEIKNPELTELYNSTHLRINFDKKNNLFTQEWNHSSPLSIKDFQEELLAFKNLCSIHRPKFVLWLQEDFGTNLSNEDQMWIEENVNVFCLQWGLEKCAFVVGKDVMAQILVFNFFEEVKSCLSPKHFSTKEEAIDWLLNDHIIEELNFNDFDIKFNGKTEDGKSSFILETSSQNTEATLKTLNHILKENAFLKAHAEKFISLTSREKEIFEHYAKGDGIKKIAEKLFLSELTVRTHWRNAKKKLGIKSLSDISDYKNSFFS